MEISSAEAGLLFNETPVLNMPAIRLLVAFAESYVPSLTETDFLKLVIDRGLACPHTQVHFFYSQTMADTAEIGAKISQFQPEIVLHFSPASQTVGSSQIDGSEVIYLPILAKIEQTLELKKELWALLKPYKVA